MSATVAAALKKIAVALFTNPKVLKTVLGIVLGILIIIIMPIAAVIGIFNGDINIDIDKLQQQVEAPMSAEEIARLQLLEKTMNDIETKMTEAGMENRVKEAQVLYTLALSDYAHEDGFVSKLVGCFSADQTDDQLIAAVNFAFGTQLTVEDFGNVMNCVRGVIIDTSAYVDKTTKNNLDLVTWANEAYKSKWGYVMGTYGEVLTEEYYTAKKAQYPEDIEPFDDFIRSHWLGRRTADCIGLIKGYGWYDTESKQIVALSNGMPDLGATGMYDAATEKGTIDTMPEIPGLAVYIDGQHIGIYVGDGYVIHASNTEAGVIKTKLSGGGWTHWLKIPYIQYIDQEE